MVLSGEHTPKTRWRFIGPDLEQDGLMLWMFVIDHTWSEFV